MSEVNIPHPNLKAQFYFFKLLIISGIVNIMHAHTEAFRRITDYLGNICNRLTGKVACSLSRRCSLPRVKEVFYNASLYHSPALLLGGGTTAHLRPVNATGYVPALLLGGGTTAHPLRVNTTGYVPVHTAGETENVITPSPSALAKNHDYQHVDSVLQTIEKKKFDITAVYGAAVLSKGSLEPVAGGTTTKSAGKVTFAWEDNSTAGNAKATDKSMLLVYNPAKASSASLISGAARSSKTADLNIPTTWTGDTVHAYMAFVREDGSMVSSSKYLGEIAL